MEEKKLILGLDVSTKTIGICLMLVQGDDKKLIKVTSITPNINKNIKGVEQLFLKKQIFENEFLKEYVDFGIDAVVIEEPLLRSNNVNTISVLLRFNGMISDSIYNTLNIVPEYISSYDARKYAFPDLMAVRTINKKGEKIPESKLKKAEPVLFGGFDFDIDKKVIVREKISTLFPNIQWEYNKKDELLKCNYDSSDAIACVLGWLNKNK